MIKPKQLCSLFHQQDWRRKNNHTSKKENYTVSSDNKQEVELSAIINDGKSERDIEATRTLFQNDTYEYATLTSEIAL